MSKLFTCFITPSESLEATQKNYKELAISPLVKDTYVIQQAESNIPGLKSTLTPSINNPETLKNISLLIDTPYIILYSKSCQIKLGQNTLERMAYLLTHTETSMVYSDYQIEKNGQLDPYPLIDYQMGSLRDDFNFGCVWAINSQKFKEAVENMTVNFKYAALYELGLNLSLQGALLRIPEFLYTESKIQNKNNSEKQFDYVNPLNRNVQIEMEQACTEYLKKTDAWIERKNIKSIEFIEDNFPIEASIVIPVKNRERTISDAIHSILKQNTKYSFNILIVDNHSTDNTSSIISELAAAYDKIIHIIPDRMDLGIGGCWNVAIKDERCGCFCIQLDSDDLYIDENVIQCIIDTFYQEKAAAVIGSYRLVNFNLEEIPPGIIDHREWTDENGMNNGLRINGFGAPRAFYTPIVREITFPNTSYGEDYAMVLAISGMYKIARIYKPLYLCRRWEDNSDASLSVEKENKNNFYKDRIRTFEFLARQKRNRELKG